MALGWCYYITQFQVGQECERSLVDLPSRLSTSKRSLITLINLASWIVCTVALLPEPWKASNVGFTSPPQPAILGIVLGVMYVLFSVCPAIAMRCRPVCELTLLKTRGSP
jgi:hypothetical protein